MISNPVQFAVVREDPEVETAVMHGLPAGAHAMLIGSGGCTASTLRARFPQAHFTLVEPNQSQIDLILRKEDALAQFSGNTRGPIFGVGAEEPNSLNACGNFESLFRGLRNFIYEFVMERDRWISFFDGRETGRMLEEAFASKYWPVAFKMFMSDPLLVAMFGPDAVQHAEPGSYPFYFQKVIERGLVADGARDNYFLHHILLGHYLDRPQSLPAYLTATPPAAAPAFAFLNCLVQDVPSFGPFDLVSFSNIFDWMNDQEVQRIAARVGEEMKPGAFVIYRQLNNPKNLRSLFGPSVLFDTARSERLRADDRSLFYSGLHIGRKVK